MEYLPSAHTPGGGRKQSCKCESQVACAEMCIKQGAVSQRDGRQCRVRVYTRTSAHSTPRHTMQSKHITQS